MGKMLEAIGRMVWAVGKMIEAVGKMIFRVGKMVISWAGSSFVPLNPFRGAAWCRR